MMNDCKKLFANDKLVSSVLCNEVDLELFPQVLKQTAYLNTLKHIILIIGVTARQQTLLLATYLYIPLHKGHSVYNESSYVFSLIWGKLLLFIKSVNLTLLNTT